MPHSRHRCLWLHAGAQHAAGSLPCPHALIHMALLTHPCPAAGIAAFGCMRALNTLLESCSESAPLLGAMEEVLSPLLTRMLSTEGQDVFEEVRVG